MYYQPELNKTALESLRTLNLGGLGAIQYQSHRHFLNLFVTKIIVVPPPPPPPPPCLRHRIPIAKLPGKERAVHVRRATKRLDAVT